MSFYDTLSSMAQAVYVCQNDIYNGPEDHLLYSLQAIFTQALIEEFAFLNPNLYEIPLGMTIHDSSKKRLKLGFSVPLFSEKSPEPIDASILIDRYYTYRDTILQSLGARFTPFVNESISRPQYGQFYVAEVCEMGTQLQVFSCGNRPQPPFSGIEMSVTLHFDIFIRIEKLPYVLYI